MFTISLTGILTLALLGTGEARADGIFNYGRAEMAETANPPEPYMRPAQPDVPSYTEIYDGDLPSIEHLDNYYESKSTSRGQYDCKEDWQRLRALPVSPQPMRATLATLEENARKVGLSNSKLRRVVATFLKNQDSLPNQRYISVIDFDIASNKDRLFIIDLLGGEGTAPGTISTHRVAHGEGSGPKAAVPTKFSNRMPKGGKASHASSLGCAIATFSELPSEKNLQDSKKRHKLLFQGMEDTNDNVCLRSVFMHPANYVRAGGRSYGCPAVEPGEVDDIYGKLKGGGLVCSYRDGEIKEAPLKYWE